MMVTITGMDSLLATLDRMQRGAGLRQGITRACREVVEKAAVGNCPVDTGELQRSITSETPGPNDPPIGIVGTNKEYAPYVEMGTGLFATNKDGRHTPWVYKDAKGNEHVCIGQKPQPFLQPALQDNRDNVVRLIKEGVMQDVKG